MKRLLVRWLMPEIHRELIRLGLRSEQRIITPTATTNAKNIKINYTTQEAP